MSLVGVDHVSEIETSFLEVVTMWTCYRLVKGEDVIVSKGCQSWNRTWGCLLDTGYQIGSFWCILPARQSRDSMDIVSTVAFVKGPGSSFHYTINTLLAALAPSFSYTKTCLKNGA